MILEQQYWTGREGWHGEPVPVRRDSPGGLALAFGSKRALLEPGVLAELRGRLGAARLVGCSTAGEIRGTQVGDDGLVVTTVHFARSSFAAVGARLGVASERETGRSLVAALPKDGLVHVLAFAVGHGINGTKLVEGLTADLPPHVRVTGGLAGDGERFGETLVVLDEPLRDGVVAVGLYGDRLRVGCGSVGGWDAFGPERWVTRSRGNVLYELDGRSALGLYKRFLGSQADGLPATALLFPLSLRTSGQEGGVVRTVLAVDEGAQSMTFAGDVPVGARVRLMKANFDRLIDGAQGAAHASHRALGGVSPDLALLVSCVGRKMVLRQRVEEEVEGVRDVLGPAATLTGFYSYGEISPVVASPGCGLHNQTMTVTTLTEA